MQGCCDPLIEIYRDVKPLQELRTSSRPGHQVSGPHHQRLRSIYESAVPPQQQLAPLYSLRPEIDKILSDHGSSTKCL